VNSSRDSELTRFVDWVQGKRGCGGKLKNSWPPYWRERTGKGGEKSAAGKHKLGFLMRGRPALIKETIRGEINNVIAINEKAKKVKAKICGEGGWREEVARGKSHTFLLDGGRPTSH